MRVAPFCIISKVGDELETWHSKNAFSTLGLSAFKAASEIFSVEDAWRMVSRGYVAELSLADKARWAS